MKVRLVALSILNIKLDIDAVLEAAFSERINHTLRTGIERGVLNELNNADGRKFSLSGGTGSRRGFVAAACKRKCNSRRQSKYAAARKGRYLHGNTFCDARANLQNCRFAKPITLIMQKTSLLISAHYKLSPNANRVVQLNLKQEAFKSSASSASFRAQRAPYFRGTLRKMTPAIRRTQRRGSI